MQEITVSQWHHIRTYTDKSIGLIDVRSPSEYKENALPGAVNVPLFSDQERAEIGTLYKQVGKKEAQWRAMEVVVPKIPDLLGSIRSISSHVDTTCLYCWRGGNRSGSLAIFSELAGVHVGRLVGGYKAYRLWCLEMLNGQLVNEKLPVLLHGMTGIGKTEILKQLGLQFPVLDLEGLAHHRGSIFGHIGLPEAFGQKMFDSLLLDALLHLKDERFIVMEAESKRIGKVTKPAFMMSWRQHGIHYDLQAPLAYRIERIVDEYVQPNRSEPWFEKTVVEAFLQISKRLEASVRQDALLALEKKDYEAFIEMMLVHYYDPRYHFSKEKYTGTHVALSFQSIEEAVDKLSHDMKQKL